MNIKPENLEAQGFLKPDVLEHKELIPFVQKYLKANNVYTLFYKIFHFLLFVFITGFLGYFLAKKQMSISLVFSHFSFGFVMAILLLPVHELLHGWAYKKVGAAHVSYVAEWKKLYFLAVADGFVANRKEFIFVAILPFVSISVIGLIAAIFLPIPWALTSLSMVFIHGSMCGGDFGLLSYFYEKRHLEVVTYDDVPNKVSYFYERAS